MPCRMMSNASWKSNVQTFSGSFSSMTQPHIQAPSHAEDMRDGAPCEESLDAQIERLGRQRPSAFTSTSSEILFILCISMSQLLTEFFVSGFTLILPTLIDELNIPQASSVWPATAFSLVVGSTLLVFGRLGDMFGGRPIFLCGLVWLLVGSVVAGFSINPLMLDFCRAFQGLGAAAFLPTGIQLVGSLYRPGPRKNLVFSIYGTAAVLGFFVGIFVAGMVGQYLPWGYYFWIGAILAGLTLGLSYLAVPVDLSTREVSSKGTGMDYLGACTIVPGLILIIFAFTQSAHAALGWKTPYILICIGLGITLLLSAAYVETRIASQPLLPAYIFTTPLMTPLMLALFLLYGTWGIFSVYGTLYFQNVLQADPLQIVAWYVPIGVVGLIFGVLEGFMLHLVPGRVLLVLSSLAALVSQLLLALLPQHVDYWKWLFPATICSTIGIDLPTILMTVFVSAVFPLSQQGLAGSVVNSVLQLGIAFCLGVTDTIKAATVDTIGLMTSYKNTFWFGVGAAGLSLVVLVAWGKVPKASSDLTADEKRELTKEASGFDC